MLSQYDPSDSTYQINKCLLLLPDITFVTGIITLLEFQCVLGRMWREKKLELNEEMLKELNKLPEHHQIKAISRYCFKKFNVKIVSIQGIAKLNFNDEMYEIDKNFFTAYKISPKLTQRTLDSLQIATAINIKLYSNYNIEYFLTNDTNILKSSANIRTLTQIIPVSSEDMASLLKLKDFTSEDKTNQ